MSSKAATPEAGFVNASASTTLLMFGAAVMRSLRCGWSRYRTARILQGLDDEALKDIGLHRGMTDSAFYDRRYRPRP
jgi:uncharacterized protein YjiS (DUF1127 family)